MLPQARFYNDPGLRNLVDYLIFKVRLLIQVALISVFIHKRISAIFFNKVKRDPVI